MVYYIGNTGLTMVLLLGVHMGVTKVASHTSMHLLIALIAIPNGLLIVIEHAEEVRRSKSHSMIWHTSLCMYSLPSKV